MVAKHMWGLLAWFVPVGVACSLGARPALVATVLVLTPLLFAALAWLCLPPPLTWHRSVAQCSLTRYYTYDAYYDEAKLQPRPNKDRLRSVAKCLISGTTHQHHVFTFLLRTIMTLPTGIAVCAGAAMLGWASGAGVRASIDKSIQTIIGSA
jgi:hypothetical protein